MITNINVSSYLKLENASSFKSKPPVYLPKDGRIILFFETIKQGHLNFIPLCFIETLG